MNNFQNTNEQNKKYDLEDRTEQFAINIIKFTKGIQITFHNKNIVNQLLRAGTSVGANYREANGAESKKDFRHKIAICKKEAKETLYWLELIATVIEDIKEKELVQKLRYLWSESKEYVLIFGKILGSTK